jgi:hypothetical protein
VKHLFAFVGAVSPERVRTRQNVLARQTDLNGLVSGVLKQH